MLWWLLSCAHRQPDPAVRAQQLLVRADEAWGRRGEIGYDEASRPLLQAYGLAPALPGVTWRLARWRLAEGLAAEDPRVAKSSYAEARAAAIGCLEADPRFSARRAAGWGAALAGLGVDRTPCAAWAALAWVRWLQLQGSAAASLDLEPIDALIAATLPSTDPEIHSVAVWAAGVLTAIRPTWAGQDLAAAREELEEAVRDDPTALTRQADLYLLVVRPTGSADEQRALREQIAAARATNPEDERARVRSDAGD